MCGIVAIYHRRGACPGGAGARHRAAPSPRPRRPAPVDRAGRARRAGPRAAQHHRPGDRRSADRQRGRARSTSSSTASSTTSSAIQRELGASGPPAPHALRQRDRAAPLRGPRRALPAPAARRVRLRALGRAQPARCSPPATGSASSRSSTRLHDGTLYLASEVKALFAAGVPARWDRESLFTPSTSAGTADAHAVRRRLPGAARPLPARRPTSTSQLHRYWDFDYPPADGAAPQRSDAEYVERVPRTRSRRRCGCGCAPTCRSAAI